jgi:hypothetical protein
LTLDEFQASLAHPDPPAGLAAPLVALWHEGRGNWDAAHSIAQDIDDATGAAIHAYLHRKEGDLSNAAYWYRQAGRPVQSGPLDREWRDLVNELLANG